MSPEFFAALIAAIAASGDIVLSIFSLCMAGYCESDCCCFHFAHQETTERDSEKCPSPSSSPTTGIKMNKVDFQDNVSPLRL